MFNSMMDGIKEESVGNLFNLQFEVQENPIVEEVGAGAQLAFGGAPPRRYRGRRAAAARCARPRRRPPRGRAPGPPPPAPHAGCTARRLRPEAGRRPAAGRQAPRQARRRRARSRHGGGPRSGRDPQQRLPTRPSPPTAEGGGPTRSRRARQGRSRCFPRACSRVGRATSSTRRRPRTAASSGTATAAADPYASVGRNDLCPCGSGRKYKRCHGGQPELGRSRGLDVGAEPWRGGPARHAAARAWRARGGRRAPACAGRPRRSASSRSTSGAGVAGQHAQDPRPVPAAEQRHQAVQVKAGRARTSSGSSCRTGRTPGQRLDEAAARTAAATADPGRAGPAPVASGRRSWRRGQRA